MDLSREDVRRQLDLEEESLRLGVDRYNRSRPLPWNENTPSTRVEEEANLPPGQQLLKLAVPPTAKAIKDFVKAANKGEAGRRHSAVKWLELAKPAAVAYLTAREALNVSVEPNYIQGAATRVANVIIDHVDMVTFKGKNPGGYHGLTKKSRHARSGERRLAAVRKMLANEESRLAISRKEKVLLGMAAIELLIDATGLFEVDTMPTPTGKAYTLKPTALVRDWLARQHDRSALLEPVLLPMVVRPKRWRTPRSGGYLRKRQLLIKNTVGDYQKQLMEADLSLVYEAINHIQETPWRINKRVLEVMRTVWDEGGVLGGLPQREDHPLPGKPEGVEHDAELLKEWKREAAAVHERNASLLSSRFTAQQRLWVASKFADEPAIWFPHSMDFRGRIYPLAASAVHPQADDPGKALLEFAHGLPLGKPGVYWLAVHIANLFGVDKVSFTERVEWTFDHSAQLIDSALAPLDGDRFWTTADNPWMALAASFEFLGYLREGESYVSHLPVPVDGSNSGLQHFSALLRDPVGAAAVNLLPIDIPADVYAEVARRAQAMVDADLSPDADPWRNGKVTRKIAKRPTMTFVYSATRYGMVDMILKTLRELDNEGSDYLGGADNYAAANYLSYVMFEAVSEVVAAATLAMDWLRDVARVSSDAGLPVSWTTPDGLPILQDYRVPIGERVNVHWKGARLRLTLLGDGHTPNPRAQANGISPNFVHSLDAAHLRALARAAKGAGIKHLGVIHDSFATHAARTDELVRLLRSTFVEQYRPDILGAFADHMEELLPTDWKGLIPPPPPMGDLDLDAILHSSYLFA